MTEQQQWSSDGQHKDTEPELGRDLGSILFSPLFGYNRCNHLKIMENINLQNYYREGMSFDYL